VSIRIDPILNTPGATLAALLLALTGPANPILAQDSAETPKRHYVAERLTQSPPRLDGQLDDPAWTQGTWSGGFTQREPREGDAPSEQTELKILYDDTNIYVAMRAYDTQIDELEFLRSKRDEFSGDVMGITFDSYFDKRTSFQFNVTAGGALIDMVVTNDSRDRQWNAVWDARTGREADAWVAEMVIPLSQLRYANTAEQTWGLHAWRRIRRLQEESNWQLIPQDPPAYVNAYGELHGIRGLRPSRQIEIVPYVVGQYDTYPAEPGNPFRRGSDQRFDAGLDAKIGLTSDFTLDLTVNPDFGQIEADPSEVNLSSFESFFPEQRPFFLEGRRLFEFELRDTQLFYSRRIGGPPSVAVNTTGHADEPERTRILGAAKLTGKNQRGTAVAALAAVTSQEDAIIDEAGVRRRQSVEPLTQYAVARLQQDFNGGATVLGAMLTGTLRNIDDAALAAVLPDQALTGGLDFQHRWNDREWYFSSYLVGSQVSGSAAAILRLQENSTHLYQRPDAHHLSVDPTATRMNGWGGQLRLGKDAGGRWRYGTQVDWSSPGLELNDIGFINRADFIRPELKLDYVVFEPGPWLREYEVNLRAVNQYESDGTMRNQFAMVRAEATTNNHWEFSGRAVLRSENRAARRLRGGPSMLVPAQHTLEFEVETDNTRNLIYSLDTGYDFAAQSDGHEWWFYPGIEAEVGDFLNVEAEVGYEHNLDELQWMTNADDDGLDRYLLGRMRQHTVASNLRLEANFSPRLSLTYFGSLFASSGAFSDFKRVTDPLAVRWDQRFDRIDSQTTYDGATDTFLTTDTTGSYRFSNPDFDVRELQSNLVLRWEYRPGSTLFVVWTQNRSDRTVRQAFSAWDEYDRLLGAEAENTFLVKFSYWFSL